MKKALLSIFVYFAGITIAVSQIDNTTLTKIGNKAPVFTCKTTNSKTIDISKLKDKIIMINFFATWCGPCNLELPLIQEKIWDKYKDKQDFELIIIGREHTEKEVSDFAKKKNYKMPFAPDPKREIYALYAKGYIPRNIIIGKNGRIIYQSIGYTEKEFKKIEDLLAKKLK
jgi:peroxiredoxin